MATIGIRAIIDEMLTNDGRYGSDPRPLAIYEYQTSEGATVWSICYTEGDAFALITSPTAHDARLIWPVAEGGQ